MTASMFHQIGDPKFDVLLKGDPTVHRRTVGRDNHTELDVRWGCSKLELPAADAEYLWDLLGAALGKFAPRIRTVPTHPNFPVANPPAAGQMGRAAASPPGGAAQTNVNSVAPQHHSMESGQDIGANINMAAEMFPQFRK